MRIIKPVRNLLKYGSLSLMPQVNPDLMRPIFEDGLKQLSFYSPEDHLALWKTKKEDLRFQYSSEEQPFTRVSGAVYAQEPRKYFKDVDVVSFMSVDMLNPDKQGELFDALKSIVEGAGIEKIIAYSGLCVESEDAKRLYEIRSHRNFDNLKYGLGAFVR